MAKTIEVALGEDNYQVPKLKLGQQREWIALWSEQPKEGEPATLFYLRRGKSAAEIILRRAMPPVGDLDELECTLDELNAALNKILVFTGLQVEAVGEAAPKIET
jgi:hypothetical protein